MIFADQVQYLAAFEFEPDFDHIHQPRIFQIKVECVQTSGFIAFCHGRWRKGHNRWENPKGQCIVGILSSP